MILKYRISGEDDWEEFDSWSNYFNDAIEELCEYTEETEPILYEMKKENSRKIYEYEFYNEEEIEYYPIVKKVNK